MKEAIKKIPLVGAIAQSLYRKWINPPKPFTGSEHYWNQRYDSGGNSGDGSYHQLAAFKAEVLNRFIQQHGIETVLEYGCGDGNQLRLAEYPCYVGFDVSQKAVDVCRDGFAADKTKSFENMIDYTGETAQLTLSLDVVYHLVEDSVFDEYMHRLFDSAERYVAIYSSNTDENDPEQAPHVRHRKFSDWIDTAEPDWDLLEHIPNRYPFDGATETGSFADFYIYSRN